MVSTHDQWKKMFMATAKPLAAMPEAVSSRRRVAGLDTEPGGDRGKGEQLGKEKEVALGM